MSMHNTHYNSCVGENPHDIKETEDQERFSIHLRVGVLADSLLGPMELSNRLNDENYQDFFQNILPDLFNDSIRQTLWFLHDPVGWMRRIVYNLLDKNYRE